MNVVNEYGEKQNGFAEVVSFCHVMCRYFDRFLLQGVYKNWRQACLFYLAPGLICEGYWQVNSRRAIFALRTLAMTCINVSSTEEDGAVIGHLRTSANLFVVYQKKRNN